MKCGWQSLNNDSMREREGNIMSKWSEIRCNFFDEEEEKYFVDAWETDVDNEEGTVIAKLDLANETVEYLDEDAKTDEYAQEVIKEMLEEGYILIEQKLNQDFIQERQVIIMTKTINITIEVYDGTETGKIENIISAALDSNGIDCIYDVEEVEEQL